MIPWGWEQKQANDLKAARLEAELRATNSRVLRRVMCGEVQDPEDFVVMRGSTEALIELAESAPHD